MHDPLLYYKTLGKGKAVLILHGLFGSSDNWQTIARKLAHHFFVITPDLRNHGQSFHSEVMNYAVLSKDVLTLIDHLKLERLSIIGHSMGGKVAMQCVELDRDKFDKLIVVDILPKAYPHRHDNIFEAMLQLDLANCNSRKEIDDQLTKNIPDTSTRQFILKNITRNAKHQFIWKLNIQAIYENYYAIIDAPNIYEVNPIPTLMIKGANSEYINANDWDSMIDLFPNTRLVEIPDAGHWVHADKPDELLQLVLQELYA